MIMAGGRLARLPLLPAWCNSFVRSLDETLGLWTRHDPFRAAEQQSFTPGDHNADVARYTAGKIDDLIADAIAAWFQIVGPELKDFLRYSRKRLFPARLLLIDGA